MDVDDYAQALDKHVRVIILMGRVIRMIIVMARMVGAAATRPRLPNQPPQALPRRGHPDHATHSADRPDH